MTAPERRGSSLGCRSHTGRPVAPARRRRWWLWSLHVLPRVDSRACRNCTAGTPRGGRAQGWVRDQRRERTSWGHATFVGFDPAEGWVFAVRWKGRVVPLPHEQAALPTASSRRPRGRGDRGVLRRAGHRGDAGWLVVVAGASGRAGVGAAGGAGAHRSVPGRPPPGTDRRGRDLRGVHPRGDAADLAPCRRCNPPIQATSGPRSARSWLRTRRCTWPTTAAASSPPSRRSRCWRSSRHGPGSHRRRSSSWARCASCSARWSPSTS